MNPLDLDNQHPIPGRGRITGFPSAHIRANWPTNARLGVLTDKRIEFYRAQGRYGQVDINTPPCCYCSTIKARTTLCKQSYFPHPGYYCDHCIALVRKEKSQHRELADRVKAAQQKRMESEYV